MREALSHKDAMAMAMAMAILTRPGFKPAFSRNATQEVLLYCANPGAQGRWRVDCFAHAMADRPRYLSHPVRSLELDSGFHNLRDLRLFKGGDVHGAGLAVSGMDSVESRLVQSYWWSVNHGVMIVVGASNSRLMEKLALLVSGRDHGGGNPGMGTAP